MTKEEFRQEYDKMVRDWESLGCKELLTLAYWTMWKSRWAKTNLLLAGKAGKEKKNYEKKMNQHYKDKERAFIMMKDYADEFSFYRPENSAKIEVNFCPKHHDEYTLKSFFEKTSPIMEFKENPSKYMSCPKCSCIWDEEYYSLYYLVIKRGDYSFAFYVPHSKGKFFLPDCNTLPKSEQIEQEGVFRFGRCLNEEEKDIFTEEFVNNMFNKAIAEYTAYEKKNKK